VPGTLSALGRYAQLQPRPLGGDSPPQSWARRIDTYDWREDDWREEESCLVDFVLTANFLLRLFFFVAICLGDTST